jgi:hypothetical protein
MLSEMVPRLLADNPRCHSVVLHVQLCRGRGRSTWTRKCGEEGKTWKWKLVYMQGKKDSERGPLQRRIFKSAR